MNWDAIGAIGEIAGAVAVVITLIYVALQLRENTKSLKVQSLNETFKDRSGMMRELQSNSGFLNVGSRFLPRLPMPPGPPWLPRCPR